MLTLPTVATFERDERPAYRPYEVTVRAIRRVNAHLVRITFGGEQLRFFGTDGLDQRVKIVLPLPGFGISDFGAADEQTIAEGTWYSRWRELPNSLRNPFRTYTVRAVRPGLGELDVEFVVHAEPVGQGSLGPAARWLTTVRVGDELVVVGPDCRSIHSAVGIDWHPGEATELLLVGDETAAPAICSILESLPFGVRATAFIEVESNRDAVGVDSRADVALTWVARDSGPSTLETVVREWTARNLDRIESELAPGPQPLDDIDVDIDLLWDSPEAKPGAHFYAWLAGESALIKSLRRFLVSETGIDRSRVSFMGYWRCGKAEAQ